MVKIVAKEFNGVIIDFYKKDGQLWIKRHKIGEALGYAYPSRSASKLHSRHKSKLNSHSRKEIMLDSAGVGQETVLYNFDGIKVFCGISDKSKAREFRNWVQKVMGRFNNEVKV